MNLLIDYVGDELAVESFQTSRQTVEIHISGCEACAILVETYVCTFHFARALPKCGSLPPAVEARLRAVIEPELMKGDKPAE
jgi:hypothetical protein